jgi:nickel/cobalt transporter (NicO) family protein
MRRVRRVALVLGLAIGAVVLTPAIASAHPLGNFTVNRYEGIRVGSDHVDEDYVVDMAEIPTFQTKPRIDRNGDGTVSAGEAAAYVKATCAQLARGVHVGVDGHAVTMRARDGGLTFPPGQAGLSTLRLECRLHARLDAGQAAGEHRLTVVDTNLTDRIGWREMTAVGDGATLQGSPLPTRSVSNRLTAYPQNRLQSAPDVRRADIRFRPGGSAAPTLAVPIKSPTASVARGFDQWTRSFTASVAARRLTLGLALVALAFGIGLGALHAFAPGHGKTVMAAYLVGERGTVRDGLLIGVTVATTHTIGVLVLGLVLTASQTFAPESVYPWLGLASGVTFVALGVALLLGAMRRRRGVGGLLLHGHHHVHPHGHAHDGHAHHDHPHHDHAHDGRAHTAAHAHAAHLDHHHDHDPVDAGDPGTLSRRRLLTLGFAGGLVPTPTAIVVLLGATAIGRAWFGVALVLAYGVGMAATLVGAGLLLARARRRFELRARGERFLRYATVLPIATAVVVTGSGLWLVARAAASV